MTKEEAIRILYEMESKTAYSGELGGLAVDMAIQALRKEQSLPSNLEESAKRYAQSNTWVDEYTHNSEYPEWEEHTADVFKAGAEWMASQGQTSESMVFEDMDRERFISQQPVNKTLFNKGEEVIVQIRKKI